MGFRRAASLAVLGLALTSVTHFVRPDLAPVAMAAPADVSDPIAATAVRDIKGNPVGRAAYDDWTKSIEAGDMEAFLQFAEDDTAEIPEYLRLIAQTVQQVVSGDIDAAHKIVEGGRTSENESVTEFMDYLDAWLYALEGEAEKAIDLHRSASGSLPGLTADLSLASLLEALGREDQALAVYRALTPGEITAPQNLFDPQGIVFNHIQTVVNRRTLLLWRLGRVDEAIAVYQRLAEAEPEQAVRYAAAIESLKTGRGLEAEPITPRSGFSRALFDLSLVTWQAKFISAAQRGIRLTGLDPDKSGLDQVALLIVPEDEDYRSLVIGGLQGEALFEGAAHVALSGPEDTPDLLMSASRALLQQQDQKGAELALKRAVKLSEDDPDETFGLLSNAARVYMLLEDQKATLDLTSRILDLAENDAESASANATVAVALAHFGRHEEALPFAREARRLDDTHDRRVFLATALGKAGEVEEAKRILNVERLKRPNDPYTLNSLGYFTIEHTDDYANGYLSLQRARTMVRSNPYIDDSVGWALYKLGHITEAMRFVERSRQDLLPHLNWEVEDHYGDLLWLEGRKDEATAAWERALTQYPPLDIKASILEKLAGDAEPRKYEKQAIPTLRREDEGEVARREI